MSVWLAVLAAGLGSYLLRVLPLLLGERVQVPERVQATLQHAGVGGITALLVLGLLAAVRPEGGGPVLPVVAAVVAALVSTLLGRSMATTVLTGAAAYGLFSVPLLL